ncbi:MAG: DUF2493 domain-containing protein [Candidatus Peribacteraceae bacterium]|nr:DUF2493 domain-containing protein [Candidatus Peribacteraceae bacterium]
MRIRIIIAGSRSFSDYNKLSTVCNDALSWLQMAHKKDLKIEIVSGGANGADQLGERYAKEKGHTLTVFKADWNKYGKSAGYKRNAQMAKYADILIAFWDGESKGTKHMINLAEDEELKIRIERYK